MKTFFEHVKERGVRPVARELGLDPSTVSRCYNAKVGIRDDLLDKCEQAWGDDFARPRTVLHWDELRRARSADAGEVVDAIA